MGIKTAEFQHGTISAGHPAYNYSDMLSGNYTDYLPDYLLTYGDFWSEQIHIPVKKISIGNPFLTELVSKKRERKDINAKKELLICTGGTVIKFVNTILASATKYLLSKGIKVSLRPHPTEREVVFERYSDVFLMGAVLDQNENYYDSISNNTYAIVEGGSTLAYELLAFNIPVSWYSKDAVQAYVFDNLFRTVNSLQEVVSFLEIDNLNNRDIEYVWKSNWKKNYSDFLNQEINL